MSERAARPANSRELEVALGEGAVAGGASESTPSLLPCATSGSACQERIPSDSSVRSWNSSSDSVSGAASRAADRNGSRAHDARERAVGLGVDVDPGAAELAHQLRLRRVDVHRGGAAQVVAVLEQEEADGVREPRARSERGACRALVHLERPGERLRHLAEELQLAAVLLGGARAARSRSYSRARSSDWLHCPTNDAISVFWSSVNARGPSKRSARNPNGRVRRQQRNAATDSPPVAAPPSANSG